MDATGCLEAPCPSMKRRRENFGDLGYINDVETAIFHDCSRIFRNLSDFSGILADFRGIFENFAPFFNLDNSIYFEFWFF